MFRQPTDLAPTRRDPSEKIQGRSGTITLKAPGAALVVDSDPEVAVAIAGALRQHGWRLQTASTVAEARLHMDALKPSIVLVDMWEPDGSGVVFVRDLSDQANIGIIVIAARSDIADRVVGLELGADDYITKPFSLRELTARVNALSRRMEKQRPQGAPAPAVLKAAKPAIAPAQPAEVGGPWMVGSITLDPQRLKVVMVDGTEQRLTGAEAELLRLMLEAPDRTVDRDTISERVLGQSLQPHQRGVDQLASVLRRKLAAASEQQIQVLALRGRGYRLVA
jgi:DNA-binding response OmpR family regulator